MDLRERVLKSESRYQGPTVSVEHQQIELADGRKADREIVHHQPAVAILPLKNNSQTVVLVKQWRSPAATALLELPAGKVEAGEDFLTAAKRELNEETRLQAAELSKITEFYTSPGFTDEYMALYQAVEPTKVTKQLPQDADENLQLVEMSLTEAHQAIGQGLIKDAKTIMGLWYWQLQMGGSANGQS